MISRPGPVETAILGELAPTFAVRRCASGPVTMRYLEGGSGPPVCLLHGRGHAATMWFPQLAELAKRHRVIAIDLPGFGQSAAAPFVGGSEEAVSYFVEPVELLLARLGLSNVALIGHSLGGLVALELALRGAIAPSRLVLLDAMGLGPEMTTASRVYFRAQPERVARAGAWLFGRIAPMPATPTGKRLAALEHELCNIPGGRRRPAAAFNALFPLRGPAFNRRDRLRDVEAPVLVVWGEHDQAFPVPVGIAAAAALPRAELELLPLGHSPHLEAPERVAPLLQRFLD
jgi:pimeloyl-ACP methyl ester carboxylesterase